MKKQNSKGLLRPVAILALALTGVLSSCDKQEDVSPDVLATGTATELRTSTTHTFYGPATPLGKGVARAWVQTTKSREPLAIGMSISARAVANLSDVMQEFSLLLPKHAAFAPFKTVTLDWNPSGHDPEGVYNVPHFDMHFYTITDQERMMIAPGPQTVFPDSKYLPENFVTDGFAVPMMGVHWINLLAPEWNGGTFTHTFLFGSYQRDLIFYEPMITLDFLQSLEAGQTVTAAIPQPEQVQVSGYYPTHYTITHDPTPGEYIIALTGMRYREAQ